MEKNQLLNTTVAGNRLFWVREFLIGRFINCLSSNNQSFVKICYHDLINWNTFELIDSINESFIQTIKLLKHLRRTRKIPGLLQSCPLEYLTTNPTAKVMASGTFLVFFVQYLFATLVIWLIGLFFQSNIQCVSID